jgi:Spy/CpxP family protein refolding chaperone
MRCVRAKVLTAGLMVLMASPAFAQRPPGFPGGPGMMQGPNAVLLLWNEKVQEELKLTDDQKSAVRTTIDQVRDKYRDDFDKARADLDLKKMRQLGKARHEELEKTLIGLLQPEQAKRLKQIELQAAGLGAFSRTDVLAALNLTDRQKKDVKEVTDEFQEDVQDLFKDAHGDLDKMGHAFKKLRFLRGEAVNRIVAGLADEQKKTWQDLTGDRFEVALHPPGPAVFGPPPGGPGTIPGPNAAMLLWNEKVQAELKLTDEQKADLAKGGDKVRDKYKGVLDRAWTDMDFKRVNELGKAQRADLEKAALAVLTPEQTRRLKQIEVQAAGLNAFSREDIRDMLGLTEAQAKSVTDAIDGLRQDLQDLLDDAQDDLDRLASGLKQIQSRRTETYNKVVESLTDDQLAIWQKLVGRKFDVGISPGVFIPPVWAW